VSEDDELKEFVERVARAGRAEFAGEEPSADLRQSAMSLREIYVALRKANFTQAEGLWIIGAIIAEGMRAGRTAMGDVVLRLHWQHPTLGRISENVCESHGSQVLDALRLLDISCRASDGSVGPGPIPICLRCQVGPAVPPRDLLRKRFV
jgi:hypothetical protein